MSLQFSTNEIYTGTLVKTPITLAKKFYYVYAKLSRKKIKYVNHLPIKFPLINNFQAVFSIMKYK